MRTPACFALALGLLLGTLVVGNPFLPARPHAAGPSAGAAPVGAAAVPAPTPAAAAEPRTAFAADEPFAPGPAPAGPAATLASFSRGGPVMPGARSPAHGPSRLTDAGVAIPEAPVLERGAGATPALALAAVPERFAARVRALPAAMLERTVRCEQDGDSLWLCLRDGRRIALAELEREAERKVGNGATAPRD